MCVLLHVRMRSPHSLPMASAVCSLSPMPSCCSSANSPTCCGTRRPLSLLYTQVLPSAAAIDKLDKEPWAAVRREMVDQEKGLAADRRPTARIRYMLFFAGRAGGSRCSCWKALTCIRPHIQALGKTKVREDGRWQERSLQMQDCCQMTISCQYVACSAAQAGRSCCEALCWQRTSRRLAAHASVRAHGRRLLAKAWRRCAILP